MTGKRYYISTVDAWHRHNARFANSHWFALAPAAQSADRGAPNAASGESPILVLVEADEGAHLALEDDPAFEPLPHPLTQKPISAAAQKSLASLGVPSDATTFDVAEALSIFHPLLRHRVF
jgi:hypothetical protein